MWVDVLSCTRVTGCRVGAGNRTLTHTRYISTTASGKGTSSATRLSTVELSAAGAAGALPLAPTRLWTPSRTGAALATPARCPAQSERRATALSCTSLGIPCAASQRPAAAEDDAQGRSRSSPTTTRALKLPRLDQVSCLPLLVGAPGTRMPAQRGERSDARNVRLFSSSRVRVPAGRAIHLRIGTNAARRARA